MTSTRYLHIENEKIPCEYIQAKGRSLSLRFLEEKAILRVGIPKDCPQEFVEQFIRKKQPWILKQYRQIQKLADRKEVFWQNIENKKLLYMGKEHQLLFKIGHQNRVQLNEGKIIIHLKKVDQKLPVKTILYPALRALAKNYLIQRTKQLATHTHSTIKAVRIKDHSSKWGSCSSLKNINLNWHLIFLPPTLIDYVIIHELMHLREMNHSKAFWNWVGRFYPNYQQARKELKTYQWLIGIFTEEQ